MIHQQLRQEEYHLFPRVVNPTYLAKRTKLTTREGFQRLVELDRYSIRDNTLQTLKEGDLVVAELKYHPVYPVQGYGSVKEITETHVVINIEYPESLVGSNKEPMDLENFKVSKQKVVKPLETYWEQISYRAAKGVASVEKSRKQRRYWFRQFFNMLAEVKAVPGGRILYGAGSGTNVTLFNCFVTPPIEDSRKGISRHREKTMEIMSRGGGVGSNGSPLRPTNEIVQGVNGKSSGSVSWLGDLANLTNLVQQGGSRRGAQMIALGDWHPDLIHFILCKVQNPLVLDLIIRETESPVIHQIAESLLVRDAEGSPIGVSDSKFMTGANISVLVSDDLMSLVETDEDWEFRFPDINALTPEQKEFYDNEWKNLADVRKWEELGLPTKTYAKIKAKELWHVLNVAAKYSAEPGMIFMDTCNNESNSWYYAPLVVTNPCGEQPLPAWAVCNLIAINLANFYNEATKSIDYLKLRKTLRVSQRFADNVIDHSYYFLEENEEMAKNERRVGKGVMGLADLLIKMKIPYGSPESLELLDKLFEFIKVESYLYSAEIAEEKGSFPYYNEELFLQSGFMKRMPEHVIGVIREKGIRNVCSLTVAPTGSTGTMVGVATGLEPYFSFKYYRSGRLGENVEINTAIAQAYFEQNPEATELPEWYVAANDIPVLGHVKVQAIIQKHIDSAISKTCNAPSSFSVEDNKELYLEAYKSGCKGVTVYVDGSRDTQVLNLKGAEEDLDEVLDLVSTSDIPTSVDNTDSPDEIIETLDTRVCAIVFDEFGSMRKEC